MVAGAGIEPAYLPGDVPGAVPISYTRIANDKEGLRGGCPLDSLMR